MENTKYVKRLENGNIIISPCELVNQSAPNCIKITPITITCMGLTIRWFIDFLTGTKNSPDEYSLDGIVYQAFRDSGNVYIKETRNIGFINIVGFSLGEIQKILDEINNFFTGWKL